MIVIRFFIYETYLKLSVADCEFLVIHNLFVKVHAERRA